MKKRWVILAVLAALLLTALDQRLMVQRYSVPLSGIVAPVRLALVTDFHGCDYGPGAQDLVDATAAQKPDVVLLAGDIYDDDMPWDASDELVQALAQRWPCFYVTGNHEYWTNRSAEICRRVEAAGVIVLDMDARTIEVHGQRLNICGVPDPYAMKYAGAPDTEVQLAAALMQAEPGAVTILLAHRPELVGKYAEAGFKPVLSGHAHGGQVRIPGLINGLYAPNQGLLPQYAGGSYQLGGTTLIVSRGLARESTRIPRIFNRPELVVVDLTPAE